MISHAPHASVWHNTLFQWAFYLQSKPVIAVSNLRHTRCVDAPVYFFPQLELGAAFGGLISIIIGGCDDDDDTNDRSLPVCGPQNEFNGRRSHTKATQNIDSSRRQMMNVCLISSIRCRAPNKRSLIVCVHTLLQGIITMRHQRRSLVDRCRRKAETPKW